MPIITVPNAGSTFTTCGVSACSSNRWVRLGFTATPGGSGSAMFYAGSALTDGSPLLPVVCASGMQTYMSPLFVSPGQNIIVASVSGGSAIIWLKSGCIGHP